MNYDEMIQFVENFRVISDEPAIESEFFKYNTYAQGIKDFILDENLSTPFVVEIDGVWGSGKTTLMKNIQQEISNSLKLDKAKKIFI